MNVERDPPEDNPELKKEVSEKLAGLKEQVSKAEKEQDSVLPSPTTETEQETKVMSATQVFRDMKGPEQVAAFNAMATKAKRKGIDVSPVKRFKNSKVAVERLTKLETKLASAGGRSPAKVSNGAKKPKAAKVAKVAKAKFGHDRTIVSVVENPRFKGSGAFKRYAAMASWVEKNKGEPVSKLIDDTSGREFSYRRQDFDADLKRKHIEVKKL